MYNACEHNVAPFCDFTLSKTNLTCCVLGPQKDPLVESMWGDRKAGQNTETTSGQNFSKLL